MPTKREHAESALDNLAHAFFDIGPGNRQTYVELAIHDLLQSGDTDLAVEAQRVCDGHVRYLALAHTIETLRARYGL